MKRITLLCVVTMIALVVCLPATAQEPPAAPETQAPVAAPETAATPAESVQEPAPVSAETPASPAEVAPQVPAAQEEVPTQPEAAPAPPENAPRPEPAPAAVPPASTGPETPVTPPAPASSESAVPAAPAAVEPVEIPGLLIAPEMLAAYPDLVPVDVRSPEAYAAGHLAGAISLPAESLSEERGGVRNLLKPVDQLAVLLAERGMTTEKRYVLYGGNRDVKEVYAATRVFWVLEYLSFGEVYILDGGFARWTAEGRPVEAGTYTPTPIPVEAVKLVIRPEVIARRSEIIDMVGNGKGVLVDTRMPAFYAGAEKVDFVTRAGHIPTAVNIPADPMLTGPDFRFRPLEEIRAQFTTGNDDPLERIVVYGNSGNTASLGYFLFRLLGKENIAVYDGSMAEWSRNPALNVVTEPVAVEPSSTSAPAENRPATQPTASEPVPAVQAQTPSSPSETPPTAAAGSPAGEPETPPAETASQPMQSPPTAPVAPAPSAPASIAPAAQPAADAPPAATTSPATPAHPAARQEPPAETAAPAAEATATPSPPAPQEGPAAETGAPAVPNSPAP